MPSLAQTRQGGRAPLYHIFHIPLMICCYKKQLCVFILFFPSNLLPRINTQLLLNALKKLRKEQSWWKIKWQELGILARLGHSDRFALLGFLIFSLLPNTIALTLAVIRNQRLLITIFYNFTLSPSYSFFPLDF